MSNLIIDRGRGPEIAGTRITVYDIWDYAKEGWHPDAIAATLRLSTTQVTAALDYIEQHKAQVLAEYDRMLDREARGNPAELQEKLDATHAKYQALWSEQKRQLLEADREGNSGR